MKILPSKTGVPPRLFLRRLLPHPVEALAIYAGILLYIWRWQYIHPYVWIALLAAILLSHYLHHERPADLGLTKRGFRDCARAIFPLLVVVILGGISYALWKFRGKIPPPRAHTWLSLAGYFCWCAFQEYLVQSYFHRRLMAVLEPPHLSSFAVALMFAGAHIPNPILMPATLVGGFIFAEVFARYRNVWPLAVVQAIAGFLIGTLAPHGLIHGMRVGPGYYSYQSPLPGSLVKIRIPEEFSRLGKALLSLLKHG